MKTRDQEEAGNEAGMRNDSSPSNQAETVLVYRIDNRICGLPVSQVERVLRAVAVVPLADAPETIMGIINVQGRIVPVVNMRKKLNLRRKDIDLSDQFILARTHPRTMALIVDSVEGVVEEPIAGIAEYTDVVSSTDSLKGVIKFRDDLALMYDLDHLLSAEKKERFDVAPANN